MSHKVRTHIRRKTADYFLVHEFESGELVGRIADISASGMKIISPEPLSLDKPLKLRISLPESFDQADSLVVLARGVWAKENEKAGWHESGHMFLNLDASTVSMISKITARIMSEESSRINQPKPKRK